MSQIQTPRLSDEARFELAAAAGTHERRNRPMWMVAGAAVLLGGVLLLAVLGVSMQARARGELKATLADQAAVEQMVRQWGALNEVAADAGAANIGEPMTGLRSRLEQLAREAGFKEAPFSPNEKVDEPRNGVQLRTLPYFGIKAESLGTVLEWLRLATENPTTRIPGLEVQSLHLKPNSNDNTWTVNLTLRRWERAA